MAVLQADPESTIFAIDIIPRLELHNYLVEDLLRPYF